MGSVLPHIHCHERKSQVIVHLLFSSDRESSEAQISLQESERWFYIDLPSPVDRASLLIRKQIFDYFFLVPISHCSVSSGYSLLLPRYIALARDNPNSPRTHRP